MKKIASGILVLLGFGVSISLFAEEERQVGERRFSAEDAARQWLSEHPAPKDCPSGYHPESGYWYDGSDFFAWSECVANGFHRNKYGDVVPIPGKVKKAEVE